MKAHFFTCSWPLCTLLLNAEDILNSVYPLLCSRQPLVAHFSWSILQFMSLVYKVLEVNPGTQILLEQCDLPGWPQGPMNM